MGFGAADDGRLAQAIPTALNGLLAVGVSEGRRVGGSGSAASAHVLAPPP